MSNFKKNMIEKFKKMVKDSKQKTFIKKTIRDIIKSNQVDYKDVRKYYKEHKNEASDKIVKKYNDLLGGQSLTEYFDSFVENINSDKDCQKELKVQEKNEAEAQEVFKAVVWAKQASLVSGLADISRHVARRKLKMKNSLVKEFSKKNKAKYKELDSRYVVAQRHVLESYNNCKEVFNEEIEAYLLKHPAIDGNALKYAKTFTDPRNSRYSAGDFKTSLKEKTYLISMKVKVDGKEHEIRGEDVNHTPTSVKALVNMLVSEMARSKKKIKAEDIKAQQERVDKMAYLVECCIVGMEKFALNLPKIVKESTKTIRRMTV